MLSSHDLLYCGDAYPPSDFHPHGVAQCQEHAEYAPLHWPSSDVSQEWLDYEESQLNSLRQYMEVMKGTNTVLQTRIDQVDQKIDSAVQEHMRLRNAIRALQHYKQDLQIQPPKCNTSRSSAAEPFSKWLEEDPAEAFLTFEQDVVQLAEVGKAAAGEERGRQIASSAPVPSAMGTIGMHLPSRIEVDPELAAPAAVAAAALAHNQGRPGAAFLDLVQLAISRADAKEKDQSKPV